MQDEEKVIAEVTESYNALTEENAQLQNALAELEFALSKEKSKGLASLA
jgi:hypothetical protein